MGEKFDIWGIKMIWTLLIITMLLIAAWALERNQNMDITKLFISIGHNFFYCSLDTYLCRY